jgi:hypothetical protein
MLALRVAALESEFPHAGLPVPRGFITIMLSILSCLPAKRWMFVALAHMRRSAGLSAMEEDLSVPSSQLEAYKRMMTMAATYDQQYAELWKVEELRKYLTQLDSYLVEPGKQARERRRRARKAIAEWEAMNRMPASLVSTSPAVYTREIAGVAHAGQA